MNEVRRKMFVDIDGLFIILFKNVDSLISYRIYNLFFKYKIKLILE